MARVKSGIYKSEEDIKSDSHWLNCLKGCNWWIHSRSSGFHYQYSDGGKKSLDSWAIDHNFCLKHMPRAEPVGWDEEKKRRGFAGKKRKVMLKLMLIKYIKKLK